MRSRSAAGCLTLLVALVLYIPLAFVSWKTPMSLRNPTRHVGTAMKFKPGIKVEKMSKEEADKKFGVSSWPTWGCDVSKFDWQYSGTETAYILEGEVTVTPTGEWADVDEAEIEAGDLVTFPDGMTCVWDVKKPINKHYNFSWSCASSSLDQKGAEIWTLVTKTWCSWGEKRWMIQLKEPFFARHGAKPCWARLPEKMSDSQLLQQAVFIFCKNHQIVVTCSSGLEWRRLGTPQGFLKSQRGPSVWAAIVWRDISLIFWFLWMVAGVIKIDAKQNKTNCLSLWFIEYHFHWKVIGRSWAFKHQSTIEVTSCYMRTPLLPLLLAQMQSRKLGRLGSRSNVHAVFMWHVIASPSFKLHGQGRSGCRKTQQVSMELSQEELHPLLKTKIKSDHVEVVTHVNFP